MLVFSNWPWLWVVIVSLFAAVGLLSWSYRAPGPPLVRWAGAGLKSLGVAALAFCLLEPLWSGQRARPGANLFAIVADNSQGLQVIDRGENRSRAQELRDLLNPQRSSWQEIIERDFDVRRYTFDTRLQNTKDFEELKFDGRSTGLGSALSTLAERYRGRPLAGVLLLTDGNATDIRGEPKLEGLPPIYPVVIGRQTPIKDISVQQTHVSQTAFEDAPVALQAEVRTTGYKGRDIAAHLLDFTGKTTAQQTLRAREDDGVMTFRFELRPEKSGLCFYRLYVRAQDELTASQSQEKSEEATLANNSRVVVVDRGRGPHRILYVAGRPNWEFKFLNRALEDDDQLQLVAIIRVARREPKFNFLGRAGETSNPLFRGFSNQAPDEVERYDQPVLVRLNTRDELELRAGFPTTPEALYGYDAVIVDDLEAEFFTAEQAALLQRYVSERGGGFLMLGGMECFQEGKYQHTPIGDMLPVYLERAEQVRPASAVHLNLTREGWLQSWARLRDNEAAEKARLQSMAPFQVLNTLQEVKPGASVIATVADEAGKSWPALVVQRFGRGRTAALTIGDVWRWGLHDADAHKDMDKAWRQLMRWLVTDTPNRVELSAQPASDNPDGGMELQVRVRDPKFQPLDNASVDIEVQPTMTDTNVKSGPIRLHADPSTQEPGTFSATYVPRLTAGYKAVAWVTNSAGLDAGHAEAGWSTDLAAEEFQSLTPNVSLLEKIAHQTKGEVISAERLEAFARSLPHRHAPIVESWTFPLWHTPAMFGLALVAFLGEWGLRRWKGLP